MLAVLQYCVAQLARQQFAYRKSGALALAIVKDIFGVLDPEHEDAGLTILLQLLQANVLTEHVELFVHVLGTITAVPEKKYFLPLLVYCKCFLPISNFIGATQQLVRYMKAGQGAGIPKALLAFDVYYSSINVAAHTRLFAAFTEAVFRLLHRHRAQFVDVFEHLFCRAGNSALDQLTYCIGQVHSKEALQEALLFNVFLGIPSVLSFAPHIVGLFIQRAQGLPKFLAGLCRVLSSGSEQG